MGRPASHRDKHLHVIMSAAELRKLDELAGDAGVDRSTKVRLLVLEHYERRFGRPPLRKASAGG